MRQIIDPNPIVRNLPKKESAMKAPNRGMKFVAADHINNTFDTVVISI